MREALIAGGIVFVGLLILPWVFKYWEWVGNLRIGRWH